MLVRRSSGVVLDVLVGSWRRLATAILPAHLPLAEALHGVRAVRGAEEVEQARLDDARGAVDAHRLLCAPVELQRPVRQERCSCGMSSRG